MLSTVLSLVMLGIVALLAGSVALWRRGGSRKQVALMIVLAAIMAINVAIWTLPDSTGTAPVGRELH
jgi:hypothetical protein